MRNRIGVKHYTVLLIITLCTVALYGQQNIVTVPGHSISFGDHKTVSTTIKNVGAYPARIFLRYDKLNTGNEFRFLNDSLLAKSLVDGLVSSDSMFIEIAKRIIPLLKNSAFNADTWFADETTSSNPPRVASFWSSPMGTLHGKNTQKCSNYSNIFIEMCVLAGVPRDSLRIAIADSEHTIAEIFCKGVWNAVDCDPWMCIDMVKSQTSPSGYASAYDFGHDLSLAPTQYLYNGINLYPGQTVDDYMGWWRNSPYSNYPASINTGLALSGDVMLCKGCEIQYSYTTPDYYIDTLVPRNRLGFHKMFMFYRQFQQGVISGAQIFDSINKVNDNYFNIPGNIILMYKAERLVFGSYGNTYTPQYLGGLSSIKIHVPNMPDTVKIGQDLSYAGLILADSSTDSIIISGAKVMDKNFVFTSTQPLAGVASSDISYLQKGMVPPHVETVLTVSATISAIGFDNGFDLYKFNPFDSIEVTTYETPLSTAINNDIPKLKMEVFPNPAKGLVFLQTNDLQHKQGTIYNAQGCIVGYFVVDKGRGMIDVSTYTPGLYLIGIANSSVKLFVN